MVDMTTIGGAIAALSGARNVIQGLTSIRDASMLADAKISLQGTILEAQSALFTAQQEQTAAANRISDLEKEVVRLKEWESQKEKYELQTLGGVAYYYALKKEMMQAGELPHWLCTNCFDDRKKSILQALHQSQGQAAHWHCNRCDQTVLTPWPTSPVAP